MKKTLVSIIIPTFNRANLIVETLDSLLLHTYQHWECIIIDDGSTDNTEYIVGNYLKKDSRFRYYHRPKNRLKGGNAARNYGFELCKGEYVNWFDSDDVMDPDFIKFKILKFKKEKETDAVISKTAMFKDNIANIIGKENRTFLTDNTLQDFLKLKISWYLPDVMWRTVFLVEKELFDEKLLAGQDRDFHTKMLLFNPNLVILDFYLTNCRSHSDNITRNVNNIKNKALKMSHLYSMINVIKLLSETDKLSNSLKIHFFKSTMKYLPFVIDDKSDFEVLLKLLKSLTFFNFIIIGNWNKIGLAYISYKLFSKGERFLK